MLASDVLYLSAGVYGNEKEAGDGVQRAIKEGLVKREELCMSDISTRWR